MVEVTPKGKEELQQQQWMLPPNIGVFILVILPLPQNVKDYLLDDGTLVVSGREDPPARSQPDSDDEAEEIQWSDDENTATLTVRAEKRWHSCHSYFSVITGLDLGDQHEAFDLCLQCVVELVLDLFECFSPYGRPCRYWTVSEFAVVQCLVTSVCLALWALIGLESAIWAPEFPEFTTKVQEAINSLGGSVFPKLNWSAPRLFSATEKFFSIEKYVPLSFVYCACYLYFLFGSNDAYWIAMNSSLKCKTLSDIFLLFKSSDFITRDFTQPCQCFMVVLARVLFDYCPQEALKLKYDTFNIICELFTMQVFGPSVFLVQSVKEIIQIFKFDMTEDISLFSIRIFILSASIVSTSILNVCFEILRLLARLSPPAPPHQGQGTRVILASLGIAGPWHREAFNLFIVLMIPQILVWNMRKATSYQKFKNTRNYKEATTQIQPQREERMNYRATYGTTVIRFDFIILGLVLRKWCELIPGAEFRCFVKENKLIGISQRDYTQYYDHISKQKEEICRCIQDFFRKHIQYKFLDEDFVFDIYRDSRGKVWLIDFNPFGEVTDSLLFTWEELISERNLKGDFREGDALEQDSPAFRCTNSEVTVQPSPYLSYRLPKDFVDLSTGEDAHKLIDFLKLKRNQQEDE
ncbi:hypothetical protein HPG69_008480 [Diceros bicornis minor]|uniref:Translation initiation factor eIF2 assembly protein n=1 Tax=Diceros bicornis minor TaxID=77932 RepID=A0A7J7FKU2_DICBM|nr:hypothetical protein HPG69_008480 [Diceros bicornis minor]